MSFFSVKVAWRYLSSNPFQTLLLLLGVAIGVIAFIYITSLINGLRDRQIRLTTGNIAHITLEPQDKIPQILSQMKDENVSAAVQPDTRSRPQIRNWTGFVESLEAKPYVTSVSPVISGGGFIVRSQSVRSVSVTGIFPDKVNAIAKLEDSIVEGSARLDLAGILVGKRLADDLGLQVGQTLRLRSERTVEQNLTIRGIFSTGSDSVDRRTIYMNFYRARAFLDLPYGITEIQVRIQDLDQADKIAPILGAETDLKSTSWIEQNPRLFDALSAQRRSGTLIQSFSMLTILIGVTSALLLAAYRRKSEIGIMRAFGLSRNFVKSVFVIQGLIVGVLGSCLGAFIGWELTNFLLTVGVRSDGSPLLPIDPKQGGYELIIPLTILGSMLASLIPASNASKVDPVDVIGG
jgi:lipoprotein-releasing system permease protein